MKCFIWINSNSYRHLEKKITPYSLLVGRVHEIMPTRITKSSNHQDLIIVSNQEMYQANINVESVIKHTYMRLFIVENISNSQILSIVRDYPEGIINLEKDKSQFRVDLLRNGIVDPLQFVCTFIEGSKRIGKLIAEKLLVGRRICIFGNAYDDTRNSAWKNEIEFIKVPRGLKLRDDAKKEYEEKLPGKGLHEIHMNQGNLGRFREKNRPFSDGAIFILEDDQSVTGVFLSFSSQPVYIDNYGNPLLHNDAIFRKALDQIKENKNAALLFAAEHNMVEVVISLLNAGADVMYSSPWKVTSLHLASFNGELELVKILVKHGSDTNAKTEKLSSVLHYAVFGKNIDVINFLIENNADRSCHDIFGYTPDDIADALKKNFDPNTLVATM